LKCSQYCLLEQNYAPARIAVVSVIVTVNLPAPGCPMHDSIAEGVKNILLGLEGVTDVEVEIVWDPPWHPSIMTEVGRAMTGVRNF